MYVVQRTVRSHSTVVCDAAAYQHCMAWLWGCYLHRPVSTLLYIDWSAVSFTRRLKLTAYASAALHALRMFAGQCLVKTVLMISSIMLWADQLAVVCLLNVPWCMVCTLTMLHTVRRLHSVTVWHNDCTA
jgi:hypothetical protein